VTFSSTKIKKNWCSHVEQQITGGTGSKLSVLLGAVLVTELGTGISGGLVVAIKWIHCMKSALMS